MRPTRVRVLVAVAVLTAAAVWGLLHVLDATGRWTGIPVLPWTGPVGLVLLAVGITVLALSVRARLRGDPGTRPVPPLHAARMVVLAKACSHAGALLAGVYGGVLAFVLLDVAADVRVSRALVAGSGIVGAGALAAAGLVLERVLQIPEDDDTDSERTPPTASAV